MSRAECERALLVARRELDTEREQVLRVQQLADTLKQEKSHLQSVLDQCNRGTFLSRQPRSISNTSNTAPHLPLFLPSITNIIEKESI